jgi:hypothetical protein
VVISTENFIGAIKIRRMNKRSIGCLAMVFLLTIRHQINNKTNEQMKDERKPKEPSVISRVVARTFVLWLIRRLILLINT